MLLLMIVVMVVVRMVVSWGWCAVSCRAGDDVFVEVALGDAWCNG